MPNIIFWFRILQFFKTIWNFLLRYILEGAPLIAIHKARYYKRSDGLALGPGAFVAGLEYSTGKEWVLYFMILLSNQMRKGS